MDPVRLIPCSSCKKEFPITEEYWFPVIVKKLTENPHHKGSGPCKKCANEYSVRWRKNLKEKGLTRKFRKPVEETLVNRGVLYIIGSTPRNPVKIGITRGTTVDGRIAAIQTSHWLELKVIYHTPVISEVELLEKELHKRYKDYRVKGEWFKLSPKKISKLILELQEKNLENRNPEEGSRK